MAKIESITGWINRGKDAQVFVTLEDGTEGVVWVGGSVEVFHDAAHDVVKCFVKRSADKPTQDKS